MSAQQLVGAAGVGLVVANMWTGPQRAQLSDLFTTSGDPSAAHPALKAIGAELLGVGALTLLAGSSGPAGNAAALVVVALWVLFLIHRNGAANGGRQVAPGAPQGTAGAFQSRPT